MNLLLSREPSVDGATIGYLFVDGKFLCFTLEDVVRAPGVKIPGETAIPSGTYKVLINKSQRLGRMLPLILDVPYFSGIRIHGGNDASSTSGCILVGLARCGDNRILSSQAALSLLMAKLAPAQAAGEAITITIQEQPAEQKVVA